MTMPSDTHPIGWLIALTMAAFVAFFCVIVWVLKLGLEFIE
jgi:hypothetical protein